MTDTLTTSAGPEQRPPQLSSGSRTTIRALLVVTAVLLLLGSLGGLTAAAVGVGSTRVIADSAPLPATMRSLAVDTADLPMAVRVIADPKAREARADLRFVGSAGVGRHSLEVTSGATDTRVTVRGQRAAWLPWARAGEITVVLPPELGRRLSVTTNQQVGLLLVDADLDRLVARADDGAVILRGSARAVDVHTRDGSVYTREPISVRESFSVNSIDGDVNVDFKDVPPRRISAVTGDGDITIGLPGDGPFAVQASTGSQGGDTVVRVPQASDAASAQAVVSVQSANGDVAIESVTHGHR